MPPFLLTWDGPHAILGIVQPADALQALTVITAILCVGLIVCAITMIPHRSGSSVLENEG